MSNLTDALIAAKLVGGSGGSGGGSGPELFVIHGKLTNDDALLMEESFAELESAWNAGKVLLFALPYNNEITSSYLLVSTGAIKNDSISSFIVKDLVIIKVPVPGGSATLKNYTITIHSDSSITETFDEYPLT